MKATNPGCNDKSDQTSGVNIYGVNIYVSFNDQDCVIFRLGKECNEIIVYPW